MATQPTIVNDIRGVCPVCGGELDYAPGSLVKICPRCVEKKHEEMEAFARAKASAGKVQVWGGTHHKDTKARSILKKILSALAPWW